METSKDEPGRLPLSLPPRPAALAGREDLLAELHGLLTHHGAPHLVVLSGMGGVGKTSLAAEYAHRHLAELSVAWQIPAENETVLVQHMAQLASELGGRSIADSQDPVASVHRILAAWPAPWLLIFDNALDDIAVRPFVPPAGPGRVIVTSQSQHWPGSVVLDVPVLDSDVAAKFLVARAGDIDEETAGDLADELGGLPLALEQAAAYAQAAAMTLASYLGLFRRRRAELLERGIAAGHPLTVTATIGVALYRLEGESPSAIGLLRVLACLAPEPVPLYRLLNYRAVANRLPGRSAALLAPLAGDEVAIGDAVADLRRYSLISLAGPGMVLMHRLIQAVALDQLTAEATEAWRQAAAVLVEAAIPEDSSVPDNWPYFGSLLTHAQATLSPDKAVMSRVMTYLGNSGHPALARDLAVKIAAARERVFGPDHRETLDALGEIAYWAGRAGDLSGALEQLATLLPVMQATLGPEDAATLASRHNFANWTGYVGDAAAARDELAELLPVNERVFGPEHLETLKIRGNLAYWTGFAGDFASARDQYAALLMIKERALGPEYPETLVDRGNLAFWTGRAGNPDGARNLFAELVATEQRVFGPEHPVTLIDLGNLGRWTGEAGDATRARDQFMALLPVRERVSGPDHPDTLTERAGLARWTGEAGDAAAARDQFMALLVSHERIRGAENPRTLTARGSLARWTGEAGDAVAARDQFMALLPVRERVSGPDHPDTLTERAGLARWTGEAGDAVAARDQFMALLPVRERVSGPDHPDTLTERNSLAYWMDRAAERSEQ